MYGVIVRHNVRAGFRSLSAGKYEQVLRQFDPQISFSFVGPAPLGGELRGIEAAREWFQRLFTYFPGLQFTVRQVIVQGWPWNTLVATRLLIAAPRPDGSTYQNSMMQFLHLRWGKVIEDQLYEDTYKLAAELQQRLHPHGTEEANTTYEHISNETARGENVE